MSKVLAALLASALMAFSQSSIAAENTKDFSGKGKASDARKKGQTDSSKGSSSEAPRKKGLAYEEERRGATPATPATPAVPRKSPAVPATPATPPSK